jgi:hypothetical protein
MNSRRNAYPLNKSRQTGQAIIEFAAACLVMIPLFVLIPLLAKYIDVKQTTIAASRKLAFECTVRYDDCENLNANTIFADEVRTRFFAGSGTEILSNDKPATDAIAVGSGNPLWVDRSGNPLLEKYSDVGVRADAVALTSGAALLASLPLQGGPGVFALDLTKGVFDARVQVQLSAGQTATDFLSQMDSLRLNMQFHTAILTNAWNARGPGTAADLCNPSSGTVVGRSSNASLCPAVLRALDQTAYLPAELVMNDALSVIGESNAGNFRFHKFIDQAFVDKVPLGDDSTGFRRGR